MDWTGRAWIGVGALGYAGAIGDTRTHRHAAHQIICVAPGSAPIEVTVGDASVTTSAFVVPGGVAHALRAASHGVTVYLDVDTPAGRGIGSRIRDVGPDSWAALGAATTAAWRIDAAAADGKAIVSSLVPRSMDVHPYVRRALDEVARTLPAPVDLAGVSDRIGVSASHLSRLWRADLGLSFAARVRWSRLRAAAVLVGDGATITDAAHAAGFADGGHLSRVCREMFGLPPQVLRRGIDVV